MTLENFELELGKNIRQVRRLADLTQMDLAKKIGCKTASYICDIEKGRKSPSVYQLIK